MWPERNHNARFGKQKTECSSPKQLRKNSAEMKNDEQKQKSAQRKSLNAFTVRHIRYMVLSTQPSRIHNPKIPNENPNAHKNTA